MKNKCYIICKEENKNKFRKLGFNDFCTLEEMILYNTISFDFETTGLEPRNSDVFCCQISNNLDSNYLIVLYDNNYTFYDVIPFIKRRIICGHNLTFDLGFMYKYDFWPEVVKDTMIASKIIYNGDVKNARHDFGTCMSRELKLEYDKSEQKYIHNIKLSQASTIEYSFRDVDRLSELQKALEDKIVKGGFIETYNLHCRYIRALSYMQMCGLPISSESWKEKMDEDLLAANNGKNIVVEYIYDNLPQFANNQIDMFDGFVKKIHVNLTSPLQMIKVFKAFNIPVLDKDGNESINEDVISKSDHEFVKLWLTFQNANHRVTTFGETIYQKIENERIYTNFNPMVDTARLSTRKGQINFLNFPADKKTRYCFKANKGNIMIVCDYSGQETVIAADLSGDEAMTKSVVEGADLHCLLARVLFPELEDLTDEEIIKSHKDKRQASKSPRFAFQYGGNAYTIHMNEGIPLKEAQIIENSFKNLHKGLYVWGDKVLNQAIKNGYIDSVDGWKLQLPFYDEFLSHKAKIDAITKEEWTDYKIGKEEFLKQKEALEKKEKYTIQLPDSFAVYKEKKKFVSAYFKQRSRYLRLCLNNPVQTRGAHQIKLASCLLFEWIVNNNLQWLVKICNSIHDELVVEAIEELAEEARKAVQEFMLEGGNHYLTNLVIKADANIGCSWGEAK